MEKSVGSRFKTVADSRGNSNPAPWWQLCTLGNMGYERELGEAEITDL